MWAETVFFDEGKIMIEDLLKQYPELLGMDKEKLDFILEFSQKDKPKTTKEALPFILAYMNRAKKLNLNFSKPEVLFISELLMKDMNPEEKEKVQKMLHMMNS
jgi:hypothetical protein